MERSLDAAALLVDQRWLVGLARGLVGDEQAVDDVLQETRLRAWRTPPSDGDRAGGWLRRVARNVALRMRSSEAARRVRESAVARPERTVATDELVARVELQRAVADAVLALEEPYRAVILHRFFDELPPRVIAERLGVPVETVRTRIKRGLAQLREQLDRRYGPRDSWAGMLLPGLASSTAWSTGVGVMSGSSKVVAAAGIALVIGVGAWQITAPSGGDGAESAAGRADVAAAVDNSADGVPSAPVDNLQELVTADRSPSGASERASVEPVGEPILYERVRLVGRVVDAETRAPVAGAQVTLRYYGRRVERNADRNVAEIEVEAQSKEDGWYEAIAAAVTHNYYSGEVTHRDYACATLNPDRFEFSKPQVRGERDGLQAELEETLLYRGTLVSGRVVLLPDRTPVADAELFSRDRTGVAPNEFALDSAQPAGRSRADGSFELAHRLVANRGPLVLYAVSAGRIGFALLRPERNRDRLDEFEIAIEPQGSLDVRVVDEQGAPVANVALTAYPTFPPFGGRDYRPEEPPRPLIREPIWQALFLATTDGDGRARFPSLPEGRNDPLFENQVGHPQSYRIHAVAEGWPAIWEGVLIARGKNSELEIELRRECVCAVRGRISDDDGGPIADAVVRVEGFSATRSDGDGCYVTAQRPGPLGEVDAKVEAAGFTPGDYGATRSWVRSRLVTRHDDPALPPCEEFELDFKLARASAVRGRVVDEDGGPIADVEVRATGIDQAEQRWVKLEAIGGATGADGTFVVEGVSGDFLSLEVTPPKGFLEPFPMRIRPGEQGIVVTLLHTPVATARLVATIVDATTDQPIDPVTAYVCPLSTSASTMPMATCAPGEVTAGALFVGEWELVVLVNDGRRSRTRFTVTRPDETVQARIAIGVAAIVEGVLFLDGKPFHPGAARWWVWVRPGSNDSSDSGHAIDADGRPVSGVTDGCAVFDAEGRFRVGKLTPGMPIRFVIANDDAAGAEVTVQLTPGETRRVEFHLAKPAKVQWRLAESLPPGRIVIETAHDEEVFARLLDVPSGAAGSLLGLERVGHGRLHWRAEFTSSIAYPPEVRVAEGEVDLAAGEAAIVDIGGFE